MLIDQPNALPNPTTLPSRPPTVGVLMARPTFFEVEYVINPYMAGNVGNVNKPLAMAQWQALHDVYLRLGYEVHVIEGVAGLPDLVFTANQSFPAQMPDGSWAVVMSHMRSAHRRGEEAILEKWYKGRNARTFQLSQGDGVFEGCGDCRWHPDRRLIYGGYGFRTELAALAELSTALEIPVVPLRLVDPAFYHLDTCLSPLNETTALIVEEAFEPAGLELLRAAFPQLIAIPIDEAKQGFAGNGNSPDGKHFVVHHGNPRTADVVRGLGLEVIEVDTGEFLKSGGSVFCMTMMLP